MILPNILLRPILAKLSKNKACQKERARALLRQHMGTIFIVLLYVYKSSTLKLGLDNMLLLFVLFLHILEENVAFYDSRDSELNLN